MEYDRVKKRQSKDKERVLKNYYKWGHDKKIIYRERTIDTRNDDKTLM